MNIYTITALLLCAVLTPVITATVVLIHQDSVQYRRDERWLGRFR